jgi:hypothetical protein
MRCEPGCLDEQCCEAERSAILLNDHLVGIVPAAKAKPSLSPAASFFCPSG